MKKSDLRSQRPQLPDCGVLWGAAPSAGQREEQTLLLDLGVQCLAAQLRLCNPMECSPPGSSVHGIFQAILEWVAMPSSRGSSRPRDQTQVSCIAGRFFTI